MAKKLYWNTVTPLLRQGLESLMKEQLFNPFRIVGGTALSLQLGHRMSIDIDLFTDAAYGSLDFQPLHNHLKHQYAYLLPPELLLPIGPGTSYFAGNNKDDCFKLDLFYTDPFIRPFSFVEDVRLATLEEIAAMKMDVIQRGGRKKDFWDVHELLNYITLPAMIAMYKERHPYVHDANLLYTKLTDFLMADDEPDPICLHGKYWELIKLDIAEAVQKLSGK